MKLPFRSGKEKQGRTKSARSTATAAAPGRFSLRSQMLLLMLVGILLVVVPPAVMYLQTVLELKAAEQKQSDLSASMFAGSFRQWVDRQAATAEMVSKDPQLARLLTDGTEDELVARAESLAYLFPSSVRVRLLPPGIDEVDLETSPPISYAALDMLRHSETQDTPPPVEVHMSGTPQQHINLVRRILDPSGRRIVGHLMVSFSVQQLQRLLGHGEVSGYVELQQVAGATPLVLGSYGSANSRQDTPDSQAPIVGSRWQVAYWASDRAQLGSSVLMTTAGLAGSVAAVLLVGLIWFVFRKVGLALGRDQATLLTIVKDMNEGRVKPDYSNTLVEMYDTIELMVRAANTGAARAASGATAPEEAKGSSRSGAEDVVDEVGADLLFDESALDIARADTEEGRTDAGIFRAYDIRGIVGETLSAELAYDIGRAIGSEAYYRGEQTVVVGRDGRLSGPDMAEALIRGLKATGRDVKDIGQVPTPVLYFAAQYLGANSGVMVTGSHNPKDYNGFKIVLGGETLANEAIDSLRQRIESGDMLTGEGSVEEVDVLPDYIERVKSDVQVVRPIKVVVDCGNGVAGEAAPKLLKALGCEVVELFCEVDGNFPNHHPDPGKTENLAALIQAAHEKRPI